MGSKACKVDFSLSLSLAVKSKNACPSTEGLVFFWAHGISSILLTHELLYLN